MKRRIAALGHAFRGIKILFQTQIHAWIHAVATIGVLSMAWYFQVTRTDWLFLVGAIALVWVAELLNTAIEFLSDAVSQKENPFIKKAKDVAAGAVLVAAFWAAVIGISVFWGYF